MNVSRQSNVERVKSKKTKNICLQQICLKEKLRKFLQTENKNSWSIKKEEKTTERTKILVNIILTTLFLLSFLHYVMVETKL